MSQSAVRALIADQDRDLWRKAGKEILSGIQQNRFIQSPNGYVTIAGMWVLYLVGMYAAQIAASYYLGADGLVVGTVMPPGMAVAVFGTAGIAVFTGMSTPKSRRLKESVGLLLAPGIVWVGTSSVQGDEVMRTGIDLLMSIGVSQTAAASIVFLFVVGVAAIGIAMAFSSIAVISMIQMHIFEVFTENDYGEVPTASEITKNLLGMK